MVLLCVTSTTVDISVVQLYI